MQIKSNWQTILKRAWSIRLIALSACFTAAEVVVPLYSDVIPRDTFALLSAFTAVGALVSRVVTQQNMSS